MTYVLWGITPEGRANNLGEVVLDGDHAKLLSTTDLQTFGLIVTAEPYFAVTQPSDVVVAEVHRVTGTIDELKKKECSPARRRSGGEGEETERHGRQQVMGEKKGGHHTTGGGGPSSYLG